MKFMMTVLPAIEASDKQIQFVFETAEQMVVAKDTAAGLLLFIQDELRVMKDYSNMFVLEEKVAGEWEEYEEF